jgi:hypothetical protein
MSGNNFGRFELSEISQFLDLVVTNLDMHMKHPKFWQMLDDIESLNTSQISNVILKKQIRIVASGKHLMISRLKPN